jgi:hypothetical protein
MGRGMCADDVSCGMEDIQKIAGSVTERNDDIDFSLKLPDI